MTTTLDSVRDKWDDFSGWFDQDMAYNCLSTALVLQMAVGARHGGRILEVGCGTGQAAHMLMSCIDGSGKQAVELTAVDLAPKMVEAAQQRMAAFPSAKLQVANAEALPFDDTSFDRLYSNLCLQLTPDADAMLRECARVLTPGGQAAFTVWGRPELSPMMEIVPEAMFEAGLVPKKPPTRASYHLGGDLVAVQARVKAAGFSSCQAWRSFMPCSQCPEAFCADFCKTPTTERKLATLSAEKRDQFKCLLKKKAQAVIDAGHPLALEVVIIHATK